MSVPQAETPMMRQFNAIKREHPDKLLFYRMGDFYEMFGDDAIVGAEILQIALTSRDKKKKNSLPMCGVPYKAYEQYLNKLTAAGYKVAICEQLEDPAKAKGLVTRDVVRVVTPGTTVSPQLIDPDRNHYLLSIKIGEKRADQYMPLTEVKSLIQTKYSLTEDSLRTGGPARYVHCHETDQKIGFITPHTHNFCELCNRVRITCTGEMYM